MLKQNLIISYSNQKVRVLKSNLTNSLDKVITLKQFANELFEKYSFKTIIEPIIAKSFIYKVIKEVSIEYFDFIAQSSDTLDLIYDFILKIDGSKMELADILDIENTQKFEAITLLRNRYIKFKEENDFVDENDIYKFAILNIDKYNFSLYENIFLDEFELENVKFYKSNLELELLNILKTKSQSLSLENNTVSNSNTKLHKLEKQPFDINDEVQSAFKLARKILEENENLSSEDICIVTSDIDEYASIFRLYLLKYELKGYDSKGKSLALYNNDKAKSNNSQVIQAFANIDNQIKQIERDGKELDIFIDSKKLKEKLIKNTFILEDKIGIELTEANQLVGLNKKYEHIIFMGADINHFPPKRNDNFLYTSQIAQEFFCENNYYLSSLLQYNELKRITNNLYILFPKYKEKRELSASIIIDKNISNSIDISNIEPKKHKIENIDFIDSVLSNEFTNYDGLDVKNVLVNHLSASQLGSYAKCPLKYLYTYKLKIKAPRDDEEGFDPAEQGTLMHSCFETFSQTVQGYKNLKLNDFKILMYEVLQIEYDKYMEELKTQNQEENIYHQIFKQTLAKGLKDENQNGILINFINYYDENKEELNYFIDTQFEKEFALDKDLKPYTLLDKDDKNYFIKGYIDRFDNLQNQINIIDYKSKKADAVLQDKLDEIKEFKDFQLGLYSLYAKEEYKKEVDSYLLTFKTSGNLYTQFARLTTNEKQIPKNRGKDSGVLYDDAFEENLKVNILRIKQQIEDGDFRFDSSNEAYCGYCEVKFMCNNGVKGLTNESK